MQVPLLMKRSPQRQLHFLLALGTCNCRQAEEVPMIRASKILVRAGNTKKPAPAANPSGEERKGKLPPKHKAPSCGAPSPDGNGRIYRTGLWVSTTLPTRLNPDHRVSQPHAASEPSQMEPTPVATSRTWETTIWADEDASETLDRILQASIVGSGSSCLGPHRG